MNIFQLRARQIEPGFLPCSDGEEDRVELAGKFIQRNIEPNAGVEDHLHTDAFNEIQLPAQHGFGQPVLGNGEAQHSSGLATLLENRYIVAEHGQVKRGRQASWARAGHGHLAAGRR